MLAPVFTLCGERRTPRRAALPFTPDPDVMLTIHNLDKSFGGLKVIDDVSFTVQAAAAAPRLSDPTVLARRPSST